MGYCNVKQYVKIVFFDVKSSEKTAFDIENFKR
ncbi:hypothetical protein NSB1T_05270 [Coprobacter fastidiosus NSB1 = JCM 33896]|nr:hypothetical protein NSB1T_05270 [Coprobacter fastidiosus NSB1 = JCM 33896]